MSIFLNYAKCFQTFLTDNVEAIILIVDTIKSIISAFKTHKL